jgi:hypothetical protein
MSGDRAFGLAGMDEAGRDFNGDLAGAASAFRMRPDDIARHDWTFLADDLARWTDSGPVGLRIDALYVHEGSSEDRRSPTLLQLLRGGQQFEQIAAPREVQAILDARPRPFGRGGPPWPRSTYWAFLPDVPALVTPLIGRSRGDRGRGGNGRDVYGDLVVVFNKEALLGSLLPELEARFVPASGEQPYQLAVFDPKTSQVLFSNAEIPAKDFLNAERQLPLVYTAEELIARFAARRGRVSRCYAFQVGECTLCVRREQERDPSDAEMQNQEGELRSGRAVPTKS